MVVMFKKLINHAKTIEDPELRQVFVERLVDLMMQMHPQNRNMDDYREKLWKHAFRIGRYELEVTPPSGIAPNPEDESKRPEKVDYPEKEARYRHLWPQCAKTHQKSTLYGAWSYSGRFCCSDRFLYEVGLSDLE